MAESLLKGRVRASKTDDDGQLDFTDSENEQSRDHGSRASSGNEEQSDEASDDGSASDAASSASDVESAQSPAPPSGGELNDPLATISFGTLASAQSSLGSSLQSKKRKRTTGQSDDRQRRSTSPFHEAAERQAGKKAATPKARSSKHAPVEMSSKKAVSRKREVVPTASANAARDPRFSALSGRTDETRVRQNYAFLDDYRSSELSTLRQRAQAAKAPAEREALRQQVRAAEDRERARRRTDKEREVLAEHRRAERDAVRDGNKQPFFLKRSEVRRRILTRQFEELGEKKAEKVMERRRKKNAQRERKNMPDARRAVAEG